MTTLKPQLIRADTLDLQNQDAPSAKDHTKQPAHPAPLGAGPAAPHQNQALRQAEQDSINERLHGPNLTTNGQQGFYDDTDDGDYDGRDGMQDDDGDYGDQDGDDGLDDDMMDKISSSPSIDDEDIDFEFVYALHTFVATVEGQANATKGDTMVLLDDSNSYWWLVRVVKDGSIGYLPAEHIETPTERLARLNKHRNIDLSATMLGDNAEKSKNPLKKAMRRRNAKTVQFAAPTYHEAPDVEYSDEDEEDDVLDVESAQNIQTEETEQARAQDEPVTEEPAAVVEPLKVKSSQPAATTNGANKVESSENFGEKNESPQKERTSDELFDRRDETVSRSRNGTVRNTDSFFKDETVETKKISLTPRLLRGDSDANAPEAELIGKPRPSLEDKLAADDKGKEDKKKKEKKPSVLSGLFKRKEKKGKLAEGEEVDLEKNSSEQARASPQPRDSNENVTQDARVAKMDRLLPQRQPSKLQKMPPTNLSPVISPTKDEHLKDPLASPTSPTFQQAPAHSTLRQVISDDQMRPQPLHTGAKSSESRESPNLQDAEANRSSATKPSLRTIKTVESDESVTPTASQQEPALSKSVADERSLQQQSNRFSESPVEVSPVDVPDALRNRFANEPPGLIHDVSSSDRPSISPVSSTDERGDQSTAPTTMSPHADPNSPSTTHSTTPSWSDASLRAYMDNDDDIRDLLIIVHDKSNVVPAGPDHPVTGNLFGVEKGRLAEMQASLDSMLTNWLARKNGAGM